MAILLCIETTGEKTSFALARHEKNFTQTFSWPKAKIDNLLPALKFFLNKAEVNLSSLNGIAFSGGPGSFTGIRIGLGMIQGIAVAYDLKVYLLSSLQILAQSAYRQKQYESVCVLRNAHMGQVYVGYYQIDAEGLMEPCEKDSLISNEAINIPANFLPVGEGISFLASYLEEDASLFPEAIDMIPFAKNAYAENLFQTIDTVQPFYLRQKEAWKINNGDAMNHVSTIN
jgi:tRNA threonylcarbamoyladenosine biosynthesis protein TsaB